MDPKDLPTQPDGLARTPPTRAPELEPTPQTPPTQMLGTPIVSIATAGNLPAGLIEAVTLVERREDPGNGSELDSVILGPGIDHETSTHETETRNATTVRTRTRRRGKPDADPRGAGRRSIALLAGLVVLALLITGVSALLRDRGESVAADEPVAETQAPRVDVQAASPQAAHVAEAERANETASPALLPPPDAEPVANGSTETVHVPSDPAPKASVSAKPVVAARPIKGTTSDGSPLPGTQTAGEGKSWIKVRE
ncbi:MAG: hypothetical protein QM756_27185 [Polyangiaceae bacterium]